MTTDLCTDDVVVHIGGPQIISQSETRATVGGVGVGGGGAELGRKLLVAAREGDTAAVLELMAKGTPFATDWLGTSPLHLAASNGHVDTCAVLLRAGVSRDSRTKVDRTALHLAAYEGHESVVTLLVEQGAQVDCRDMLRMTPLHWAAQRGHAAAARELLRAGADPLAVSKFGATAVSLARRAPPAARDHISLVLEEAVRAQEAAHSVHALVSEERASGPRPPPPPHTLDTLQKIQESNFTQKNTSPTQEQQQQQQRQRQQEQEGQEPGKARGARPHRAESRARTEKRHGQSESESEGAALQLLRRHGITLLPADEGTTVLSALQSGRSVVLSDAGKLMLRESAAPAGPTAPAAPKIFTLNNNQLVPASADNSQNLQVKYVQLPSEGGGRASAGASVGRGRRATGTPVKIILNRANFTKLLSPLSSVPAGASAGGAGGAGAGEAVAQAESVLRVSEQWVASCSPKQLRAHALHARRALAALLRQYRAARSPRRT